MNTDSDPGKEINAEIDPTELKLPPADDMALRLATARTSDSGGQVIFPITANITADSEIIDPEVERNLDFDSGS